MVKGFPLIEKPDSICEGCILGKQHTLPLSALHSRTLTLHPFDTLSIYVVRKSPQLLAMSPSMQLA